VAIMRLHAAILALLFAAMLPGVYPGRASGWETVFEVHDSHGRSGQEKILQTMLDPQSKVMIGVEHEGIRIGYDSRYGFGAVIDF